MSNSIQLALRVASAVLAAALLAGCTLMIDEPEDAGKEPEENGDGFTAPKTITDDASTVTYQFLEGTILIDDSYRKYINNVVTDATNNTVEIFFTKDIPSNMIPQRGNGLSTMMYDIFERGLCHKVDYVENTDKGYHVVAHMVHTKEIFKKLHFELDGYIVEDHGDSPGSSEQRRFAGARRGTRASKDSDPFDLTIVDMTANIVGGLSFDTGNGATSFNNIIYNIKHGSKFNPSLEGPITLNGKVDAGVGLSFKFGLHITLVYDGDTDFIDLKVSPYNEFFFGVYAKSIKGAVSTALFGNEEYKLLHRPKKLSPFVTNVANWIDSYKPVGQFITLGPVGVVATPAVNVVFDVFGELETDTPLFYGYKSSSESKPIGFRHANGVTSIYPDDNSKGKESSVTETNIPNDLNFLLGGQLYTRFSINLEIYRILNVKLSADLTATLAYDKTLYSNKYNYEIPKFDDSECNEKPWPIQDSKISFDVGLSFNLDGKVDLKFTELDLFSINILPNFTLFSWNKPIRDDYELTYKYLKEKSTLDEMHYSIRVKNRSDGFLSLEHKPKYLAFYTSDGKFITYRPLTVKNSDGKTVSALDQDIEITLPGDYAQTYGNIINAILFNEDNRFATPSKFALAGVYGKIENPRQVEVVNAEKALKLTSEQQALGLAFSIKGAASHLTRLIHASITIYDSDGKEVGNRNVYATIDNYGNYNSQFLLFLKTPIGKDYTADIELWYMNPNSNIALLAIYNDIELSAYSFPEETYDFNNPSKWAEYEIIN